MKIKNSLKKLENEFNENINSHVFLVETNNYDKCLIDLKNIIKKIIKADSTLSHQIDDETYIEQIIIRPEGKDIKKDQIAELQNRLKTKPVLSDNLFYIIVDSNSLNDTASNKLLKTIEEPNDSIIGFLITTNTDLILPTIKSRCEIIEMLYEYNDDECLEDPEINNISEELIKIIETGNLLKFNLFKMDNKTIKENGKLIANKIKDYYNTACEIKKNSSLTREVVELIRSRNTYSQMLAKSKYLNKTLNKLTINMNMDLLLEKIFIELKEVN